MASDDQVERTAVRRVNELRTERGWSVEELADKCATAGFPDLTVNTLYKVLRGQRRLTLNVAFALAYVLDVSPLVLFLPATDQPVALSDEVSVPAQALYEWLVGGRPSPTAGKVNDRARFGALSALLRRLPYAVGHSRRTLKVDVNRQSVQNLFNLLINKNEDD